MPPQPLFPLWPVPYPAPQAQKDSVWFEMATQKVLPGELESVHQRPSEVSAWTCHPVNLFLGELLLSYINISCLCLCFPSLPNTAASAKSLQSSLTLCDPIDSSPPGSPVPGVLRARTLGWVAGNKLELVCQNPVR